MGSDLHSMIHAFMHMRLRRRFVVIGGIEIRSVYPFGGLGDSVCYFVTCDRDPFAATDVDVV